MNILLIESSDLGLYIMLMLFIAFGVPLLLIIIGIALRNKNKKASKSLFIIAAIYALIGLGICGGLMI